jgi:hypothetical protein
MKTIEQICWLILAWAFYLSYYIFHFERPYLLFILLIVISLFLITYFGITFTKAKKENLKLGVFEHERFYFIFLFLNFLFLIDVGCYFLSKGYFEGKMYDYVNNRVSLILFGIFISVFVGGYVNHWINKLMWRYLSIKERCEKDSYSFVNLLGTLEILVYFIALASKHPEIIGFWIGTKVVVTWQQFASAVDKMSSHHIFLIGNLLNILWATLGVIIAFGWQNLAPINR